jgi:hypothetical protein
MFKSHLQRIREALGKKDPRVSWGGFLKNVAEVDEPTLEARQDTAMTESLISARPLSWV